MNRILASLCLFCASFLLASSSVSAVTIQTVPVGNPGNAPDPATGFGAVPYNYRFGTYDVTNAQYVEFLNSNDPNGTNPLGLFNGNMSNPSFGGINFNSGAPTGSLYSISSGNGNHPVNFVTWYDAIRFANWLDNGQPVYATEPTPTNNATENGSYTLLGYTPTPSNGNSIVRNAGATIFLPSENEWYKAAFYNPSTGAYFQYATSSNTTPTASAPTATPNSANYKGVVANLTDIGVYMGTTSPYGAFDMNGNVYQWNGGLILGAFRNVRGGDYNSLSSDLQPSNRNGVNPTEENGVGIGFRVASIPEPSTGLLAVLACGLVWWKRKSF
jgi:formylglycine-generating enzyme